MKMWHSILLILAFTASCNLYPIKKHKSVDLRFESSNQLVSISSNRKLTFGGFLEKYIYQDDCSSESLYCAVNSETFEIENSIKTHGQYWIPLLLNEYFPCGDISKIKSRNIFRNIISDECPHEQSLKPKEDIAEFIINFGNKSYYSEAPNKAIIHLGISRETSVEKIFSTLEMIFEAQIEAHRKLPIDQANISGIIVLIPYDCKSQKQTTPL